MAAAEQALEAVEEKWGKPYPAIPRLWRSAWEQFTPFLDYDVEIPQGALLNERNRVAERPLPTRGDRQGTLPHRASCPHDALPGHPVPDPKGTGQARWVPRWKPALNAFAVTFADRMPAAENL